MRRSLFACVVFELKKAKKLYKSGILCSFVLKTGRKTTQTQKLQIDIFQPESDIIGITPFAIIKIYFSFSQEVLL